MTNEERALGERQVNEWHKSRWAILGLMWTVAIAIAGGGVAWGALSADVEKVKQAVEPISGIGHDVRELKTRTVELERRDHARDAAYVEQARATAKMEAELAGLRAESRATLAAVERLIRITDEDRRQIRPPGPPY